MSFWPIASWIESPGFQALSQAVEKVFAQHGSPHDIETVQRAVRQVVGKFVNERTKRRPMIVPVVMEA